MVVTTIIVVIFKLKGVCLDNKDTMKRKRGYFDVFLRCFSVFIVNFEHVNVCLDSCCIAKSSKTYLKSLAKNEYFWLVSK